jgi:aspartyl-tRNA(Asn)/glutamyl-tRNA(Gln) amidotransferase subunit B
MANLKLGFEIHFDLPLKQKLFCNCTKDMYACPICKGLPGEKPLPLKKEVYDIIELTLSLFTQYTLHPKTNFFRKHYSYPDLPKGFQITTALDPFATNLKTNACKSLTFASLHLEEDSAQIKNGHVDYKRCGNAIFELTSDLFSISLREVPQFVKDLQTLFFEFEILFQPFLNDGENYHPKIDVNFSFEGYQRIEIKNVGTIAEIPDMLHYEKERLETQQKKSELHETRWWVDGKTKFAREKEIYLYIKEIELAPLILDIKTQEAILFTSWLNSLAYTEKKSIEKITDPKLAKLYLKYGLTPLRLSLASGFRFWDMVFIDDQSIKQFIEFTGEGSKYSLIDIKLFYKNKKYPSTINS